MLIPLKTPQLAANILESPRVQETVKDENPRRTQTQAIWPSEPFPSISLVLLGDLGLVVLATSQAF